MAISRRSTHCSAESVRAAVAHAHSAARQELSRLGVERHPDQGCASQPDFRYLIPAPDQALSRAIPVTEFHRQYQLCLQALELTIYGYCVHRRFGWERKPEAVFSLRQPPIWCRILRPAPLLALTVSAGQDDASISINPARRPKYKNKRNHVLRLDQELQEQLIRIHREQVAAHPLKARICSWLKRICRK